MLDLLGGDLEAVGRGCQPYHIRVEAVDIILCDGVLHLQIVGVDTCRPYPAECASHIIGYKRVVLVDPDIERVASPGLLVALVGGLQGGSGPCRKVLLRVAKGPLRRCDQLESRSIGVDVGELVHLLAVKLEVGLLDPEEISTEEDRLSFTDISPLGNRVDKRLAITILS